MSEQINLFDANADYYDEIDESLDINKLNFKVHASLIYKLGESLIADEITALSELMKNSYDADASFCNLIIDPNFCDEIGKIGKIEISDNGCGMDLKTIINGWLTISNSPKKKMKKENETTSKYNRIPLGEKGLGRLSAQKLGRKVEMITKTKESIIENSLVIPWGEFLKNTTLDKVNLSCTQKEIQNDRSYTKIIITELINPQYWNQKEIVTDLEKTINKIISPFRFKDNNFIISAKIGDYKVDVSNALFNDILKTARSNYSFDIKNDFIELICKYKIDFFKRRNIIRDYPFFDFSRDYFNEMFRKVNISFINAEYSSNSDELYTITMQIPLESYPELKRNNETGNLYYPGDFSGKIFDFSYDKQYIEEIISNNDFSYVLKESEYKDYIKSNKGIKVIRDGFVVQGYGDGNVDWLNISASATTSGSYNDLKNESLIGYILLSGKNNQSLKETTSREGFLGDEYFYNFYSIIRNIIIKAMNKNNDKLTDVLRAYLKETLTESDANLKFPVENIKNVSLKANQVSKEIHDYSRTMELKVNSMIQTAKQQSTQITFNPSDIENKYDEIINQQSVIINKLKAKMESYLREVDNVKSSTSIIQENFENYNKRIGDIFELAGLGISVELFTHELYTTINNVNEKIRNVSNTTDELKYVYNSMNSLRKQISYFHPGLKYVRMKKETTSLDTLIKNHIDFYREKALVKEISVIYSNNSENINVYTNIGLLNQVLDNLFSNSFYWLQYSRDVLKVIKFCQYHIESQNDGTIDIWDNGIGISKNIEKDIFNPFISCKENGRGLGLFICKNNLENNGASIRLLRERNEYDNLFKFHIDLSNLMTKEV